MPKAQKKRKTLSKKTAKTTSKKSFTSKLPKLPKLVPKIFNKIQPTKSNNNRGKYGITIFLVIIVICSVIWCLKDLYSSKSLVEFPPRKTIEKKKPFWNDDNTPSAKCPFSSMSSVEKFAPFTNPKTATIKQLEKIKALNRSINEGINDPPPPNTLEPNQWEVFIDQATNHLSCMGRQKRYMWHSTPPARISSYDIRGPDSFIKESPDYGIWKHHSAHGNYVNQRVCPDFTDNKSDFN